LVDIFELKNILFNILFNNFLSRFHSFTGVFPVTVLQPFLIQLPISFVAEPLSYQPDLWDVIAIFLSKLTALSSVDTFCLSNVIYVWLLSPSSYKYLKTYDSV